MTTDGEPGSETREDIPLKTGTKSSKWYSCNEDCLGGSRFINVAFGTLTVVITVALLVQIYYGDYQVIPHGSVATDSLECSKIGTSILKKGGNAIDAAIASAFCLAVVTPYSTGLDAKGQVMVYNHRIRAIPTVIDFSSSNIVSDKLPRLAFGLAYVHQQFGTLPWKDLVLPAADLARDGFLISKLLVQAITNSHAEDLYHRLEPGRLLQLEFLSHTLSTIANITEKELYGYITSINQPLRSEAIKSTFKNYDIYVPNMPSVGPLLLKNLQNIEEYNFTVNDVINPEYTYRIAEITKNTYDELNLTSKYHRGTTSNVAVIDMSDNYVSLVTGMYTMFGSGEITEGYISDPEPENIACSRIPIIVTDKYVICGHRMVFGASDVALATQLIASLLIAGQDATESIEAPRFHILDNGTIGIEAFHTPLFSDDVLKYLETLTSKPLLVPEPYFSINIVEKTKDDLNSHSDSRGGGISSRF